MNKSLPVIIQPIIIITVVALVLFKGFSTKTESVMGVDTSNFAEVFTVFVEEGDVFYKDAKSSDFVKIKTDEIHLPNKTVVKTDDGLAHVILPDNSSISLDKFTTIEVDVEEESTNIKQLYGSTWHRIKELSKVGEYNVETDNTLAAVRGTIFGVNVDENLETDVFVVESKVDVSKIQRKNNHKEIMNTERLTTNKWVKVKNDNTRTMVVQNIPDDIKNNVWFAKNMELNDNMQKITHNNMRKVFTQIKEISNKETLGVQDENTENNEENQNPSNDNNSQIASNNPSNSVISKITKLKKRIVDKNEDEESNADSTNNNPDSGSSGGGSGDIVQTCKAGTLFQIGDKEKSQLDNPVDEFNWKGELGIFPDYAKVFVVGKTEEKLFPWNSKADIQFKDGTIGYATDLNVVFEVPKGHKDSLFKLTYSWAPGNSGSEQKEVFIDGESLHKTNTEQGKVVEGWWYNMKRITEPTDNENSNTKKNEFKLSEGTHTLTFKHLKGNGSLWDWIKVDVIDANCVEEAPLIKIGNVFMIGEENSNAENPAAEFNFEPSDVKGELSKFLPFAETFYTYGPNKTPDKEFPWNSNASRKFEDGTVGYATKFEVKFKVEGAGLATGLLYVGWHPGKSGVEVKQIYLDGQPLVTLTRNGKASDKNWEGFERFEPQLVKFDFYEGEHTLTFTHPEGDGTLWDWVKLDIVDVKPVSE